ncbi:hypothetical protein [Caulobacter sp. DWR2-3-1b2]
MIWFGAARAVAAKLDLDDAMLWLVWAMALPACIAAAWLFER